MKKQQALKAEKIIKAELKKLQRKYKYSDDEWMCYIEVKESDSNKGWFGVEIRTDAQCYENFYEDYDEQKKIQKIVEKKMKFDADDHYFEPYGQGIINFY